MFLPLFSTILIALTFVVIILVCFRLLNLPPILGYVLVGILIGPYSLRLIQDSKSVLSIADFGVMFLIFTIGLEFSYYRLKEMKFQVFFIGGLQIFLTVLVTLVFCWLIGISLSQSLIFGCIVAMSSTTIGIKQLVEQKEINKIHGNDAVAILLFQDIVAIPFFILIYSLADHHQTVTQLLLVDISKSIFAVSAILLLGHWVVRPFFRIVAGTNSLEIFTLTALLITLAASWLTRYFGLTMSLGGFLAGMILSDTDYRHQLEAVIRPFRDILVGLFFITIGMLFELQAFLNYFVWVLLLLAGFIFLKVIIVTGLLLFKRSLQESLSTGLVLAQGGEFGFAMLMLALSLKLLPQNYGQVILSSLLLSMILSIFIIRYNQKIAYFIASIFRSKKYPLKESIRGGIKFDLKNHVIFCGYGRIGQSLARIIKGERMKYVAIDNDHDLVERVRKFDRSVVYGDATLYEILLQCNIDESLVVVITFHQISAIIRILQQIRLNNKKIPIFVRTLDDSQLDILKEHGATEVIPATLETSLMLASHLLAILDVPSPRIWQRVNNIRKNRYRLFHNIIESQEDVLFQADLLEKRIITLSADAYAVGRSLNELALLDKGVFFAGVLRDDKNHPYFEGSKPLLVDDSLQVYGLKKELEAVEEFLIEGP
jgi:monovalent cation:H+ antiporter-2, CPA2 family